MLSVNLFGSSSTQPSFQDPNCSSTSLVFTSVDDDLHDARRVHAHGQEEDLRYALDRLIKRVEELSSLLKIAYKTHTELETSLSVAKSNLQLMMSNNEMLEEALQRETPTNAKDVGWRRWSAREAQNIQRISEEERSRSLDYGPLNELGAPSHPTNTPTIVVNGTDSSRASTPSPISASIPSQNTQEGRFFRFRFNNGSKSSVVQSNQQHSSHLTSPSLPSLVASTREKELVELKEQLEQERRARQAAAAEKAALEAELESLSQALFEEANKMVATERIKRAETEEELQEVQSEKDALKQALRLVEGQNDQLRSAQLSIETTAQPSFSHSRSSSRDAIKSPPPRSPSPSSPTNYDVTVPLTLPPSATSFASDNPGHPTDFLVEPAPFQEENVASFPDNSPSLAFELASSMSVSFISDEPSPWVVRSS